MLAISLALGCLCGLALFDDTPTRALCFAAAELGFLIWAQRRGRAPWWLLAGLAGAGLCLAVVDARSIGTRFHGLERGLDAVSQAEAGLFEGRWVNLGKGPSGFVVSSAGGGASDLVLVPAAGSIAEGSRVSARPNESYVPWPAGPVPGPQARAGRFLGQVQLQPDELIVHAKATQPTEGWLAGLRHRIQSKAMELEAQGPAHGLVRALLLGDRAHLSAACLDLFTRTGARHALALSGLHVGLVCGFLLLPLTALLRLLPRTLFRGQGWQAHARRESFILLIRLSFLLCFLLLVGADPPVVRAVCALSLVLLGPRLPGALLGAARWGRRPDGLSIWSAALILELICNPLAIEQLSLRLSYVATLGIFLGTTPLMRALGFERVRLDLRFRRDGIMLWLLIPLERLFKALACTLCASIAAVLCTLPDVAANFGEFSPTGVLFAPLVLPLLALLLVAAWVSVWLPVDLGVGVLADSLVQLLQWIDHLPGTPLPLPERPIFLFWLVSLLVFMSLCWSTAPRLDLLRRASCFLAGILCLPWQATSGSFELHQLDVGHGTCIVLRAPGLPALIFDAGSIQRTGIYKQAIAPLLARWEVNRPWIVLSHDDRDHFSGLGPLIERYAPRLWIGALPEQLGERLAHDTRVIDAISGRQRLEVGPGNGPLGLELVRAGEALGNEGSRSLLITWRAQKILLSGDAEGQGLAHMLHREWLLGPFRLLLFPHHGSETRELSPLLAQARPEEIWISCANSFPPVAAELDRRGIPWRTSASAGSLALRLP